MNIKRTDWNVDELSIQEMVGAMTTCNGAYDGRFYVGVISTGIYCLPSCKAKLPLIKNVVFYPTREEAIAAGLRGCRRCRAEQFPDRLPDWLHELLGYMKRHRNKKLSEADIMGMAGVDISTVRRYFKDHISMTPLAFHRKQRLNYARELIGSGMEYLGAAYECGYESSSGFREAFCRQFGKPPGRFYDSR